MNNSNNEMGMAQVMGTQLLQQVAKQLLDDLGNYGIISTENFSISWAESEGEGNWAKYLDGEIENFSYLTILDANAQAIGQGSMDFILLEEEAFLLVYWNSLYFIHPEFQGKTTPGIPDHIWKQIPATYKGIYEADRIKNDTPSKIMFI